MLEKREFEKNDFMFRLWASVAVVSGLFSFIVFALLAVNYLQIRDADPINDKLITDLRAQFIQAEARDQELAEKIRSLDLLQRGAFFTSQNILRVGGILLLVGVSVFLVAFKNMARWRPDKPELSEEPAAEREFLSYAISRNYVTWAGVTLLGMGMVAALMTQSLLAETTDPSVEVAGGEGGGTEGGEIETGAPEVVALTDPTWEEIQVNWPSFRGPGSVGRALYANAPTQWDGAANEGIAWKSPVPLQGTSSPVAWGNRVFLSGASESSLEVYCFDADSGELLWTKAKAVNPDEMPTVSGETGFAAPSMVAHGSRVFAIFANGDAVAYDFEGNELWSKSFGLPDNHYGHSSSLVAQGGLVYVQMDQSENSKLYALDTATGEERWSMDRSEISWASPILADTPQGLQLILSSDTTVDAYDPETGKHLWAVECQWGEIGPSPAYSNGVVFVAQDMAMASAIRVEGPEDSLEREILWQYEEALPDIASPIGDGDRFYFATSYGELVALDAASGEELWLEEASEAGFNSSPILVGDKIYTIDLDGIMHIVRAGAEYELIGTSPIGEGALATPAFMDGRIFIRTEENLFCVASAAPAGGAATVAKSGPAWEEVQQNWPSFRGPGSVGHAQFANVPMEWDGASGSGIKWKAPVAKQGTSSPVIWGNRVFLSGATDDALEVYCYDADSGDLLWTKTRSVNPDDMPTVSMETGFAAPTMVAHGERVFAIFANGDLVAYDFEGNEAWTKSLGLPENHYGHSSSLIAHGDLVYVQMDQSENAKLYAYDTATGEERWSQARQEISWASPILADTANGIQLILNSETMVDAYEPLTGKHLWAVDCLSGEVGPSPAYSDGVVFVANEYAMASAIAIEGSAESMEREVIWEFDDYLPEVSSPIGDGKYFYYATSYGELVCLDAATGEEVWMEEVADGFYSSPILVSGKIYILDMDGAMYIVRAGAEFELLGTASIGEATMATPAFMDGRIYLRGEENLYCIGT